MKPKASEALATTPADDAAALAQIDGLDDMPDGLGKLRPEDIKFRSYVINMKGTNAAGRKIPEDEFFDTLEEISKPTVSAAILLRRMTRAYTYFDNGEQRTKRVCSSRDEITGRMADGKTRPCKGCPDWQWTQKDGKPHRNCGPVMNLFMMDRETQQPFWFRARRTSYSAADAYLQRHHINQHKSKSGKYGNVPLFVYECKLSCRMEPGGKYALPVLERGPVLTSAEVNQHKANCLAVTDLLDSMLDAVDAQPEPVAEVAPDTSFDVDRFTNGQGQSFTE